MPRTSVAAVRRTAMRSARPARPAAEAGVRALLGTAAERRTVRRFRAIQYAWHLDGGRWRAGGGSVGRRAGATATGAGRAIGATWRTGPGRGACAMGVA